MPVAGSTKPPTGTTGTKPLAGTKPLTANQITAALLIEIPKRYSGVLCWRNNTGAGYGLSVVKAAVRLMKRGDVNGAIAMLTRPIKWGLVGSPDVICIVPGGRFLGVEVKALDDVQSPEQKAFEIRCLGLGAGYLIAEDVAGALEALGKEVGDAVDL